MSDAADTATTTTTDATTTTSAAAAKPWYDGKADAETVGYWQNKAWKHDDPVTIALEATKAAREAQKFVGVPPEQLIRLPKDAKDEVGWDAVYQRLGKPSDAKGYDLSAVKSADGTAIDEAFADTIRQAAFSQNIPKDAATAFAQSFVKYLDDQKSAQASEAKSKWDAGIQRLKESWGVHLKENELAALQGARRLGFSQEEYDSMSRTLGPDRIAEMFRKIGVGTTEDTFVDSKGVPPATAASAQARLAELQSDKAWVDRLFKGDAAARREHDALIEQVAGVAA